MIDCWKHMRGDDATKHRDRNNPKSDYGAKFARCCQIYMKGWLGGNTAPKYAEGHMHEGFENLLCGGNFKAIYRPDAKDHPGKGREKGNEIKYELRTREDGIQGWYHGN